MLHLGAAQMEIGIILMDVEGNGVWFLSLGRSALRVEFPNSRKVRMSTGLLRRNREAKEQREDTGKNARDTHN